MISYGKKSFILLSTVVRPKDTIRRKPETEARGARPDRDGNWSPFQSCQSELS